MRSFLLDTLFSQDKDSLRVADRGKTMGDNKGGAVFRQFFQGFLDDLLALVIEG